MFCCSFGEEGKDNFAYVTGLFTNKLYKVSLTTNQVVAEVLVGIGPEGMCIAGNTLYVANTGNYPNYSPSTVSVIDLNTFAVAASIPVEMNAQIVLHLFLPSALKFRPADGDPRPAKRKCWAQRRPGPRIQIR